MALIKTAPIATSAKRNVEEFVDRLFRTPLMGMEFGPVGRITEGFVPPLDLVETEKEYVLRLEVPGIPRENLDVNLVGETLTLSGHREKVERQSNESMVWEEREEGKFTRSVKLPQPVDATKIEALCQDGVLTVHLPKAVPAAKSKIVIKS